MPLSYEIRNAIIQCFGTCFYYKDGMEAFLISAGVPKKLVSRHKELYKFKWITNLLNDLDEISDGFEIQKRIVTELCKLHNLPDENVQNRDVALDNLRTIKRLAVENKINAGNEKQGSDCRKKIAEEKIKIVQERAAELSELNKQFINGFSNTNRAAAGYQLEDILEKLFPIYLIDYRKSYKTNTQQIDGHFRFEAFDYLVEAKWRKDQPNEGEIGSFKRKIDTKLESTRGIFVSINGFRDEVVNAFSGKNNIIFITGEDLSLILEGRIPLDEALRIKIGKAAQEGVAHFPIRNAM